MSLNEVQSELSAYQTKLISSKNSTLSTLDSMLEDVINQDDKNQPVNSDKSKDRMRKHLKSASQQHKNLHSSVSKIGKAVDKLEVEDCQLHEVLPFNSVNNCLENAIYLHLRLNEKSEIGETLKMEYLKNRLEKCNKNSDINDKYTVFKNGLHGEIIVNKHEEELSEIYSDDIIKKLERVKLAIQNLREKDDIQGLFTWVLEVDSKNWHLPKPDDKWQENSMAVELLLDFNRSIHCLKIIYILRAIKLNKNSQEQQQSWASQQARTVIGDLRNIPNDDNLRKELVGSLAYIRKLHKWPLCDKYLSDTAVEGFKTDIINKVVKLVGVIYKTPQNSYLSSAFNAGLHATTKLLQTRKLMVQTGVRQKELWTGSDDLPVEIELPPEFHYHSVLTCPIQRQQITRKNPAMMLTCKHVISKDAVDRLTRTTGSKLGTLKCPYCPSELKKSDAKHIHL